MQLVALTNWKPCWGEEGWGVAAAKYLEADVAFGGGYCCRTDESDATELAVAWMYQ
jgi:hypothetical protein